MWPQSSSVITQLQVTEYGGGGGDNNDNSMYNHMHNHSMQSQATLTNIVADTSIDDS